MKHPSAGASASTTAEVDALNTLAEPLISGSDPKGLLELSERARDSARRLSYARGEAYGLTYAGFARWFLGDLTRARDDLKAAEALFEQISDPVGVAKARVALLSVQKSLGVYDQSLEHNLACLRFFRERGDRDWEGACLLGLGSLHYDLGEDAKSIEYYEAAARVAETVLERWRPWMLGRALVGLGSAHQRLGELEKAIDCYQRSLVLFQAAENPMGEARVLNDLGSIHQQLGRDEEAVRCHLESLAIRRRIGQREAQVTSLLHIGRLSVRLGDAGRALEVLEEALALAEESQSRPKTYACHQALSDAYELAGDLASALAHHRRFEQVKAEVFSGEANARVKSLQTRFELEAAAREAAIVQSKNLELEEKNDELERLLAELRRTQAQLVHSEKMASLGKLVAGIAHELNTPIGALKSSSEATSRCVESLASFLDLEQNRPAGRAVAVARENARIVNEATRRMTALVKSLKSFSRLDEAALQRTDVRAGLDSVLALMPELEDRVEVVREYGDVPEIVCYAGELNQVFLTILTNAAEAIDGLGTITVRVFGAEDGIRIQISDDGRGIAPEKLDRLFDFDFSVRGPRVKWTSGLATARSIVSKHGGEISAESRPGKGTTFTIDLPFRPHPGPA